MVVVVGGENQADGLLPTPAAIWVDASRWRDLFLPANKSNLLHTGDLSVTCAATRIPPRRKLRGFQQLVDSRCRRSMRLSSASGCTIIYHYIFFYFCNVRLDAGVPPRDVFDLNAAPRDVTACKSDQARMTHARADGRRGRGASGHATETTERRKRALLWSRGRGSPTARRIPCVPCRRRATVAAAAASSSHPANICERTRTDTRCKSSAREEGLRATIPARRRVEICLCVSVPRRSRVREWKQVGQTRIVCGANGGRGVGVSLHFTLPSSESCHNKRCEWMWATGTGGSGGERVAVARALYWRGRSDVSSSGSLQIAPLVISRGFRLTKEIRTALFNYFFLPVCCCFILKQREWIWKVQRKQTQWRFRKCKGFLYFLSFSLCKV